MSISISGNGSITGATTSYSFDQSVSIGGTLTYEDVTNIDSVGVVTARSGVYFGSPGSGTQVDGNSTGIGIGTASPGSTLHVEASATSSVSIVAGDTTSNSNLQFGDQDQINTGLISYNHTDNALWFRTNGSGEDMRIDSSGRLLVGLSSATTADNLIVQANTASSTGAAVLGLQLGSTTVSAGTDLGYLNYCDSSGNRGAWILGEGDAAWTSGSSHPTRLVFSTTADSEASPTERVRITKEGWMRIGTDSSNVYIFPDNSNGAPTQDFNRANTTSTSTCVRFRNFGTIVGSITYNNASTAYNETSDYRLKENVVPLTGAIDRLNQLQVRRFNFIADPDTTVDGFLAHEAQEVVPESVTGEKDAVDENGNPEYQGIDKSKLVPLLTAALQEAIAKIETLEQRLSDAGIA